MVPSADLSVGVDHWLVGARHSRSPNCDARPDARDVSLLVIHGISLPPGEFGGGNVDALFNNRLDVKRHPAFADLAGVRVSAHLFIDRIGAVVQYVGFDARAWHAGESRWRGRSRCNDFSIGIELEGTDQAPYDETQYRALESATAALLAAYPRLSISTIVGHNEIAPERKTDPGPAFDWRRYLGALIERSHDAFVQIGIDLGGTKVEGVVVDANGHVLRRERIPTPKHDYEGTLSAVVGLVHSLETTAGAGSPVGVGTPGAWQPELQAMKNCNSTWLNGKPLLSDLQLRLGLRVRVANDADCLVLSEARNGAGVGAPTVFGAILGTGVGGGIVVRGELVTGPNAIAGEWGHTPLPYWPHDAQLPMALAALSARLPDRQCYCGRKNCVETFLSGPGLASTHTQLWGEQLDAAALVASRASTALQSVELYVVMLARALSQIVNVLDPHVIVVGGGLSNFEYLYRRVPEIWTSYVFSPDVRTALRRAQFGDSSGVLGAACLWPPDYNAQPS